MEKHSFIFVILMLISGLLQAQSHHHHGHGVMRMDEFRHEKKREIIQIPEVDGFKTLKCDLHMHTVFSDGLVWPSIRVQEAWQEGLDVIAITDHIEYHPHSKDVQIDHNRAYEIARETAKEKNILLIKGTEITRRTPPGHFNAIFIGDASQYIMDRETNEKDWDAIMKAVDQKAFIFWNHPGWKAEKIEGSYEWSNFMRDLEKGGHIHGLEVFNGFSFHKKSLDWCIEKNLTVLGTSDIHNLIVHDYKQNVPVKRSMTLVFAKSKTEKDLREALEAGRTVAWSSKYLAGKEENVRALFNASVQLSSTYHTKDITKKNGEKLSKKYCEISNNTDLYFELELLEGNATEKIILYPHSSQIIKTDAEENMLRYSVVTTFIGNEKHLIVDFSLRNN